MIRALGKHRAGALVWILALATFWIAVVESSWFHTDDGCRIELHCLACQWALSSKSEAAQQQAAPLPCEIVARTQPSETPRQLEGAPPEFSTRGPPAA